MHTAYDINTSILNYFFKNKLIFQIFIILQISCTVDPNILRKNLRKVREAMYHRSRVLAAADIKQTGLMFLLYTFCKSSHLSNYCLNLHECVGTHQ